jgi:hypothetical protein
MSLEIKVIVLLAFKRPSNNYKMYLSVFPIVDYFPSAARKEMT